MIVALGASSVADLIVLLVTWRQTYHTRKLSLQQSVNAPLASLLLRDTVSSISYSNF